ncbi:transcription factor HIVEP2 [Salmo trutta]|nr:transcription factor HIVEP2-like [Salmo trutta]XP_029589542.1 transcription factor HIVEP2-like [Salmo trutta]XP_029589543.1 transcription factor HIVEP2-like [Salmo trutta]XP_029589544.1 transcription factor HIVEP2-like [Salmo trutta]XP_029589545.1 transcription factor HIVEP2-like [Salmo trutta]XP_029589546.1 transcription factor HIVEP2-like [Salmo trutta]
MEPRESAAGPKCTKDPREKLQRKWVSEPSAGTKRSTFADPEEKRHSHRESLQSGASGSNITGSARKYGSGKMLATAMGQSSQDSQYTQAFPRTYSYQLPQPYPQQPMQERFLSGAKPQPGLEAHAWPFAGQLPSDDIFPGHPRAHGVFPRQKSPSLPSSFGQYSQSGPEPPEEGYKKEQKPKKPGKYICHYCGRACAKPSVLKKHIRSHTGERPYPCVPCGFSFKTKSNLYKHRKSHAHAIKAGLVPFSELAVSRTDMDQASSVGETEVHSDGEQSTDTDEETAEASMFMDKGSPIPQISFEMDKSTMEKGREPAYADSAEELAMTSMKVPILIVPKQGVPPTALECPPFTELKASHISSQVGRVDDSPTIKQRLALRLTEKKGSQDSDQQSQQSLNLLSPHSKGSTDSGYFSRSESAEQQISPPNTNAKSYEEIMFGRTWYYKPNSARSRQSIAVGMATVGQDTNIVMGKISEDHIFFRNDSGEVQILAGVDPKQYPTGPCQSNTGLLETPSDSGTLIRSNSMPTSSPTNLNVPPGIRVSHSFDEMMTSDDVFYPGAAGLRRLRRQAAFEHSAHEGHGDYETYGHVPKNAAPSVALKLGERSPVVPEHTAYSPYGTKVGMTEIATRKRRKEKSVGDEEDGPVQYDSSCSGSVDMVRDYDSKQGSQEGSRGTPTGKGSMGSMYSAHSQSDSFETCCSSMCSEDVVLVPDSDRKAAGNVISVIQHTNSLSRPNSFEKSESFEHPGYLQDKPSSQYSEQSDTENIEDVQSPEFILRSKSMEQQQQSNSDLVSSNQPCHMPPKLVRQPNIQVPEIRVTEEPDKPEKEPDLPTKEPEKHVEEFQWPQRSETLSQLPAEKLPPKKKRLRLADLEHSSGESSFESCTSLSRSPSQESNLSHSSSFSMSFDREENLKSVSPSKQEDFGKQSEYSGNSLTIPGHHQQREMRRSSSEQAPSALPTEIPEIRSKSFDYGSLSTSSRQGEVYSSASAMKDRRRGYLVRQASLSVYPETVVHEQGGLEITVKQEHSDHGPSSWQSPPSSQSSLGASASEVARPKRGSHHHLLQQSISEDSQDDPPLFQKSSRLPSQQSSEGEHPGHELMSKETIQYSSLQNSLASLPFLPFQPGLFWHPESTQRHKQHLAFQPHQLQKLHIRQPSLPHMIHKSNPPLNQLQQIQEQCDAKADGAISQSYQYPSRASPQAQHYGSLPSKVALTESTVLLQQVQPIFATQNAGLQSSLPGMLVPVRIQTQVPSYGSVMYTSVSQLLANHGQSTYSARVICSESVSSSSLTGGTVSKQGVGFNLSQILGQPEGALRYPLWNIPDLNTEHGRLNTGIPLSLTSGTISTTDASSSIGGSKRMLSPASSLELFIETKQQKRVKEEKMYGQIVKELSAVELSASKDSGKLSKHAPLKSEGSMDDQERMSSSPPADFPSTKIPVRSNAPHIPDVPPADSFTPPLQIVTDFPGGRESPEELDVDDSTPEASCSPQFMVSSSDTPEEAKPLMGSKIPVNLLVQLAANQSGGDAGSTLMLTDLADVQQFFQFPSLRTTTSVSWCFLNYTKPNNAQTTPLTSVYGSWCVSSYNPNPLSLSTKSTLALLCSKQRKNTETYTMAAMCQPRTGKLVSSLAWKQKFEQMKPELMQLDVSKYGKKIKGLSSRDRVKEDHGEKEASSKPAEPTRIKIFEGGYKSNEDYVYVRGRGRGKYICEECGIRCKKPSMLKKHIRTHTDVRPYVCKFCNFAFKTKGNLTKHMKSKAHMKKCLELGVSVTSVEDADAEEADNGEDGQRESGKMSGIMADHQFSDADDSDGGEDDGDEVDDDEDDDDDYDGDSTPKTRSRSTSPQPYGIPSLSITAVAASQSAYSSDLLGHGSKPPIFSYFTSLPSIQITQLMVPSERAGQGQMAEYQRLLQGALGEDYKNRLDIPSSMDKDFGLSTDHSSSSFDLSPSRLSSPGLGSSPLREPSPTTSSRKYLSPRRDLSPRGRLSPHREVSPLRHISPKRDISFRRDLSPRRDLSARGHLSPLSHAGRPTSPGRDLAGRRELSPRSHHRGMIRPVSPRRGMHHHSAPWSLSKHLDSEMVSLGQHSRSHSEMETEQKKGSPPHSSQESPQPDQGLFSHLPLHSQQQVRTSFPMIPIGGIQMVHSVPTSVTGLAHSARLPLQKSTSEESSTSEVSFHLAEGGGGSRGSTGSSDSPQRQERMVSSSSSSRGTPVPSPGPSLPWSGSCQDSADVSDSKDIKQREESIQTCTKAIASLRIATEHDTLEKGMLVCSSDAHQRHPPPLPHSSHPPYPSPQERASSRIQHFSGLEVRQSPDGRSASPLPLHSSSSSDTSLPATSKGPAGSTAGPGHFAKERSPGQQSPGERPESTKRGKNILKDATENR